MGVFVCVYNNNTLSWSVYECVCTASLCVCGVVKHWWLMCIHMRVLSPHKDIIRVSTFLCCPTKGKWSHQRQRVIKASLSLHMCQSAGHMEWIGSKVTLYQWLPESPNKGNGRKVQLQPRGTGVTFITHTEKHTLTNHTRNPDGGWKKNFPELCIFS